MVSPDEKKHSCILGHVEESTNYPGVYGFVVDCFSLIEIGSWNINYAFIETSDNPMPFGTP